VRLFLVQLLYGIVACATIEYRPLYPALRAAHVATAIQAIVFDRRPPVLNDCPPFSPLIERLGGRHLPELRELLTGKNGFLAFESALQVYPSPGDRAGLDLEAWNSPDGWKASYGEILSDTLVFAQDLFGFQFAANDKGIFSFDAEIGQLTFLADSISAWWAQLIEEPEEITGCPIGHDRQLINRPLQWEERLFPRLPFFLGGQFLPKDLFAMNARHGIEFRAYVYTQTKDLPEGTKVDLRGMDAQEYVARQAKE